MVAITRRATIVGSSFYSGASSLIVRMRPGQQVVLKRQPTNKYDANAIAVFFLERQVGHLPRGLAAELAPLMDSGTEATAIRAHTKLQGGLLDVSWDDGELGHTDETDPTD